MGLNLPLLNLHVSYCWLQSFLSKTVNVHEMGWIWTKIERETEKINKCKTCGDVGRKRKTFLWLQKRQCCSVIGEKWIGSPAGAHPRWPWYLLQHDSPYTAQKLHILKCIAESDDQAFSLYSCHLLLNVRLKDTEQGIVRILYSTSLSQNGLSVTQLQMHPLYGNRIFNKLLLGS